MKQKSIAKNAILSMLKTILSLILPLITFPYISRVLQVEAIGKYNFSASIVSYFILIAGLGISTYAIREGAKIRDDKEKLNIFFSEVYVINWISTILAYIVLILIVFAVPKLHNYIFIILCLSIQLILNLYGKSWIYNVFEEFGFITIVQIIFQLISICMLFFFVHSSNDLNIYTCISVISSAGFNLLYGLYAKKYVKFKKIKFKDLKRHVKPILIIFSTSIATTIYVNSDMTILGWIVDDRSVGLYSTAVKIYNIVKQVMVAVITVALPRLSVYVGTDKFNELFKKVFNILIFLALPAMVGLFCMSDNIISIIAGNDYIEAGTALKWLSGALVCTLVACLYGTGVLVPYNREKIFLKATVISAIVNIVGNFILIPMFKQNAAAFTTLISQFIAFLICYYHSKELVSLKDTRKNIIHCIIGCIVIFCTCSIIKLLEFDVLFELIICVLCSSVGYFIIQWILKNEVFLFCTESIRNYINFKKV